MIISADFDIIIQARRIAETIDAELWANKIGELEARKRLSENEHRNFYGVQTMRQEQREIKDFDAVLAVLDKCQVIRLGLFGERYPYVVPLSFGWEVDGCGKLCIYIHGAKAGKKKDSIARDNRVCAEADILNGYRETERGVTADYESVIAFGHAEEVFGAQAAHGIELLLAHCGVKGFSPEQCIMTNVVAVYKITVDEITGKKRF